MSKRTRTPAGKRPRQPAQLGLQLAVINRPSFLPSVYQEDIFHFIVAGAGDGLIAAAAGAGKTSTLVECAQLMRADKTLFLAFNRHIAHELQRRLASTEVDVLTVHGLGLRTIAKALGDPVVDKRKYRALVRAWIDAQLVRPRSTVAQPAVHTLDEPRSPSWRHEQRDEWEEALEALVHFVRLTLTDPADLDALWGVARRFGVRASAAIMPGVAAVLTEGVRVAERTRRVDYTDLLWLPERLALKPQRYKHVLVDECQDLNAAQLALVLKTRARGGRMLFCGDPHQSIFAWMGADPAAYARIKAVTAATELPLSISYRCPAAHIALAQTLVPTIQARPAAPAGTITLLEDSALFDHVRPGDLVICRKTAPLIEWCVSLLASKIPARVRGRDMVSDLTALARKLARRGPWQRFATLVAAYEAKEVARMTREEVDAEQILAVQDRCAVLRVCFRSFGSRSVDALCGEINAIFDNSAAFVSLSTVHRAKGLEAERVFVLEANTLPLSWNGQRPEQWEQERNLLYVAFTRAKQDLFLLRAPDTTSWTTWWEGAFAAAQQQGYALEDGGTQSDGLD